MPEMLNTTRHLAALTISVQLAISCSPRNGFLNDATVDSELPESEGCGIQMDGTYELDCIDGFDQGTKVTGLCDESNKRCIALAGPSCSAGWCLVPAGSTMLSRMDSFSDWFEYPWFPAYITRPFMMQQTEVTVSQWTDLIGGPSPSRYDCGPNCPVTGVTLYDVMDYANRLSARHDLPHCYTLAGCDSETVGRECESAHFVGPQCIGMRLPSEAEWEIAAGLGRGSCMLNSDLFPRPLLDIDRSCTGWSGIDIPAHFCGSPGVAYSGCIDLSESNGPDCAGPVEVAGYPPNPLGLYDMHGNVREYTHTPFGWPYTLPAPTISKGLEIDQGHSTDSIRATPAEWAVVGKGGGFNSPASHICAFSRSPAPAGSEQLAFGFYGFRLVRTISPDVSAEQFAPFSSRSENTTP